MTETDDAGDWNHIGVQDVFTEKIYAEGFKKQFIVL